MHGKQNDKSAKIHQKNKTTKVVCGGSLNFFEKKEAKRKRCGENVVELCKGWSLLPGTVRLRHRDRKSSLATFK